MARSKSTISLALLPVEDIANYLEIVKGFSKRNEKAVDTEKVFGIDAENIAIAYDANGDGKVEDRETVKNAMNLGGQPAENYLLKDGAGELLEDTYEVSTTVSNELKAVRDEMYQLKAELAKQGLIKQSVVYDGFYDAFRDGEIRYIDEPITTISGQVSQTSVNVGVADATNIKVNDFIGVKDSSGRMHAARVTNIINNTAIEIDKAFGAVIDSGVEVCKYAGSYHKGEFIFGKESGQYISTETKKAIVKDGKSRGLIQTLGDDVKGFATKLSNYYSTYGSFIHAVEFSLAYTGNPGNIRASIWKAKEVSESAEVTYDCLATSESVYPSSCSTSLTNVEFKFEEPIEIEAGATYLIALYCGGASGTNTWKIGGFHDAYSGTESLWFTDDTYYFDGNDKFTVIPGSTDAYLALDISMTSDAEVIYSDSGLYSCEQEIINGFTRARVELKINREGIFNVTSDSQLATTAGNAVKIAGESTNPFIAKDKIVIGNMHSTLVNDCSEKSIQMVDDMYTPGGADVYRVGYTVIAKCKKKLKDVPLQYDEPVTIELPLVSVMPGKESGKEAFSSDRLIFESEIAANEDEAVKALGVFNHIEVQVFWRGALEADKTTDNPQFAGKILDIAVSTDRSFNKGKVM